MEKHRANKIKKVNILSRVPIRNVVPPIHGCHNGIMMDTSNILKCINKRAVVNEVLPDGSTIRLNLSNYYKDNTPVVEAPVNNPVIVEEAKIEDKVVPVVEAPVVETITVVDVAAVEEISNKEKISIEISGEADCVSSVESAEDISIAQTDVDATAENATTLTIDAYDTAEQVVEDDDDSDTNTNDEEEVSAIAEAAEDHVPTYKNKKNKNHRH